MIFITTCISKLCFSWLEWSFNHSKLQVENIVFVCLLYMALLTSNSGDTEEMPQYVAFQHDLRCLFMTLLYRDICINQITAKIRFRGKERDYCIRNIAA